MYETFIDNIVGNVNAIDWEGPAMFGIIMMAVLALFRQWHIVLMTLLTFVLAWGAEDLIIMNIETSMRIVSVPLIVYSVGGGLILIMSLFAFFKMAV